ncbi:Hypothetical protein AA314_03603 [Archangium gephyra]|uniref:Uncharacterized protein n=1 Tax=Archangium gephyra TaxID=48 RepID=A0AAC8TDL5_9BACT|nr:Hypothetical protein AA314_03603 [Archangium gephyra]
MSRRERDGTVSALHLEEVRIDDFEERTLGIEGHATEQVETASQ